LTHTVYAEPKPSTPMAPHPINYRSTAIPSTMINTVTKL